MDKCREEFEKQKYWIGLFRTGVDFDVILGEFGRYISNGTKSTDAMDLESFNEKWEAWANCWQHQQAKVEDLQKQLNEYMFVAETLDEMYVKEVKSSEDLQKRVDAALKKLDKRRDELWSKWKGQADMQDQGAANAFEEAYWILEQALKGGDQ